ncbi:hypothetical protein BSU04_23645 [Caballeronia sordidicola]|uniref:Uncharacterized protein n=1 Tax=Caballeronia sordidicola TaxID=196367 RepID=A0A226WY41_CABSO|nr:hypothetical protein BSU04_23645 [Caballeronia sordidicola]
MALYVSSVGTNNQAASEIDLVVLVIECSAALMSPMAI